MSKKSILKCNHGEKSMKIQFVIYADMDSLLDKIDTCHSNTKKSSPVKINKYFDSGYSLLTHCSFDTAKNKHNYYSDKDCMKKVSAESKNHTAKIINNERKKMMPLKNQENQSYHYQTISDICKKRIQYLR